MDLDRPQKGAKAYSVLYVCCMEYLASWWAEACSAIG